MALVKLDTNRFDRLRKARVGFVRDLARETGLTTTLIYYIRRVPEYGFSRKGQTNLAAINKAMRELGK